MLHRKMLDDPIIQRPKYCHLWVVLLLKAAHKKSDFIWDNQRQTLLPGQLVTGRKKLSQETGIPESTVERILKYLESEHQIGQQTTPKFRVITIKNWEKYQGPRKSGQQTDNKRTTDGQQMDTYNNDNNVKNDNKYSLLDLELSKLLFKLILKNRSEHPEPNFEKWADDVRKLREIDKKTPEQIKAVIEYAQADKFWWDKVMSPASLRKKSKTDNVKRVDRIEMQMQKGRNGNNSNNNTGSTQPFIR